MHICLLSTYPPTRCGIATYTQNLARSLANLGHQITIVAEIDESRQPAQGIDGTIPVYRTWSRSTTGGAYSLRNFLANYLQAPLEQRPDVIHVQHEFGVFPDHDIVLEILKQTPSCITLHTVEMGQHYFNSRVSQACRHIITHSVEAKAVIPSYAIPHGAKIQKVVHGKKHFLAQGFIGRNKGTLEIIDGYNIALADGELPPLVISGLCRDELYESQIREKITHYGLGSKVDLRIGFAESTHQLYADAIAVVLGADPDKNAAKPYSASGQLATALGYGLPVIARNAPIYRSQPGAGVLFYEDSSTLAKWYRAVLRPDMWTELSDMSKNYVTPWAEAAKMHTEVYSSLAGAKNGSTIVPEPSRASAGS